MPISRLVSNTRSTAQSATILLIALSTAISCSPDSPVSAGLLSRETAIAALAGGTKTIVVSTSAELADALVPENIGARIHVQEGSYTVDHPLIVPDYAVLEGDGVMEFDRSGLPTGFAGGTRTVLTMTSDVPGNVLTLGHHAVLRQVTIDDLPGRIGNVVGVVSRRIGDRVSADIVETEIVTPNPQGRAPSGPTGCGLVVITLNPNLGDDPAPHEGSILSATMHRSIIHAPAAGACGVFAFNFAARGNVSVKFADNVIGGLIDANGGVSRTDAVHDSKVSIDSRHTLYREEYGDVCSEPHVGWNLTGGSGTPIPFPLSATERNTLLIKSNADRIEGFSTAVSASGARRFFAAPTAGPSSGNGIDLQMLGTTISTPPCGGVDLKLIGAEVADDFSPGDGNYVRVLLREVTGSGTRANVYGNVLSTGAPLSADSKGTGNRLEIAGSSESFISTNSNIDPPPGVEFFRSRH